MGMAALPLVPVAHGECQKGPESRQRPECKSLLRDQGGASRCLRLRNGGRSRERVSAQSGDCQVQREGWTSMTTIPKKPHLLLACPGRSSRCPCPSSLCPLLKQNSEDTVTRRLNGLLSLNDSNWGDREWGRARVLPSDPAWALERSSCPHLRWNNVGCLGSGNLAQQIGPSKFFSSILYLCSKMEQRKPAPKHPPPSKLQWHLLPKMPTTRREAGWAASQLPSLHFAFE